MPPVHQHRTAGAAHHSRDIEDILMEEAAARSTTKTLTQYMASLQAVVKSHALLSGLNFFKKSIC